MSYFKTVTDLFQFSQLHVRYKQWQSNPTVAIASLIIDAYNRRLALIAQNADVAQTTLGVTYLQSMKNVKQKGHMCFICAPQTHLCIANTKQIIFACHCSVDTKRLLLWNTVLAITKQ